MLSRTFMPSSCIAPHIPVRWKSMCGISSHWIPTLIFVYVIIVDIYHRIYSGIASSQAYNLFHINDLSEIRNILIRSKYSHTQNLAIIVITLFSVFFCIITLLPVFLYKLYNCIVIKIDIIYL